MNLLLSLQAPTQYHFSLKRNGKKKQIGILKEKIIRWIYYFVSPPAGWEEHNILGCISFFIQPDGKNKDIYMDIINLPPGKKNSCGSVFFLTPNRMGIKKNMIWIYIILLPPAGPDGKKKHDLDLYFITPSRMGKKNMIWIYKKT